MRNLTEHPISKSEVISTLNDLAQRENDDDRIGSISAMIVNRLLSEIGKPNVYNILFGTSEYFELDTTRTPAKDL